MCNVSLVSTPTTQIRIVIFDFSLHKFAGDRKLFQRIYFGAFAALFIDDDRQVQLKFVLFSER